jgi:hypothetical protein
MKKSITNSDYLKIIGLYTLGAKHFKLFEECEQEIEKLIGEELNSGTLFGDGMVWNRKDVDNIFIDYKIKIK